MSDVDNPHEFFCAHLELKFLYTMLRELSYTHIPVPGDEVNVTSSVEQKRRV